MASALIIINRLEVKMREKEKKCETNRQNKMRVLRNARSTHCVLDIVRNTRAVFGSYCLWRTANGVQSNKKKKLNKKEGKNENAERKNTNA